MVDAVSTKNGKKFLTFSAAGARSKFNCFILGDAINFPGVFVFRSNNLNLVVQMKFMYHASDPFRR